MFPESTYTERRKKLCAASGKSLLLLPGNGESPMNYPANTFHFRQDSHFLYFCGIDQPGLFLVLDAESGESILFGDEAGIDDIVWTGPVPTLRSLAARAGIAAVRPYAQLKDFLADAQSKKRDIRFLPPYRGENAILIGDLLGMSPSGLRAAASGDFIQAVANLRIFKSEAEIAELHMGASLTGRMHLAAMRYARPGLSEADVYGKVMEAVCRENSHVSFPVILSVNGQVLHNHAHHNRMQEGQLLLVDAGAESPLHYAGDMTRAFPVGKAFTARQRTIYEIVLAAQEAAAAAIRPGLTYKEIHLLSARVIADGLIACGLMKGKAEDAVHEGAHALFFPHGLGHMLGLDVHDMEDLGENHIGYAGEMERSSQFGLAYLRLARKLQPGFALTVEPGIYFIPELLQIWKSENRHAAFINYAEAERWMDFGGIRIEEDFVVTADGSQLLGEPLAKSVRAVEEERRKAFE